MKFIRSTDSGFVPASHENPDNPGVLKRVIATRDDLQSGQVMMVNWSQLPGRSAFQRHYHEDMQEVFVLVQGRVRMTVDGTECELQPGDAVIVDANEIHEMSNPEDTPAEYIVFGVSSERGGQTVVVD